MSALSCCGKEGKAGLHLLNLLLQSNDILSPQFTDTVMGCFRLILLCTSVGKNTDAATGLVDFNIIGEV